LAEKVMTAIKDQLKDVDMAQVWKELGFNEEFANAFAGQTDNEKGTWLQDQLTLDESGAYNGSLNTN
jgi:hypothetical protein